jgi:hypothetical protein
MGKFDFLFFRFFFILNGDLGLTYLCLHPRQSNIMELRSGVDFLWGHYRSLNLKSLAFYDSRFGLNLIGEIGFFVEYVLGENYGLVSIMHNETRFI